MRKFIYTINAVLAVLVIYLIAAWVLDSDPAGELQPATTASASSQSPEPMAPAAPDRDLLEELATRNLFASAETPEPAPAAQTTPAPPPPPLDLQLNGIIAGPPELARAIIQDRATGQNGLFRTGEQVAGAFVKKIDPLAVTLERDGQEQTLRLEAKPGPTATANQPPDQAAPTAPGPAPSLADVGFRTRLFENLIQQTAIEPHEVQGRVEGLRIADLDAVEGAALLDLRDGDVLRQVNGQLLTSKQKAFQVFRKARTQPEIHLEIIRDGQTKEISYRLD